MNGIDVESIMRSADVALYAAKKAGRGCFRMYEPSMEARMEECRALDRDLRKALTNDEFVLHFQPIVDVDRQKVVTFEALLRWDSPVRGMVAPIDFIPYAEENGLMPDIGEWVLHAACSEASTWPADISLSVNLSPAQFAAPDLVEQVTSACLEAGLALNRLELELTETCMIGDVVKAKKVLAQLRKLGIQIALDDFGTGYSSLSFLRELPFTRIKIDRSFTKDLTVGNEALAIVRAITTLCGALKVSVTAEGVETDEQAKLLRQEGCTTLQGYLIRKPCGAHLIRKWLTDYERKATELTVVARRVA